MVVVISISVILLFPQSSRDIHLPPAAYVNVLRCNALSNCYIYRLALDVIATIIFTIEYVLRFLTADDILSWTICMYNLHYFNLLTTSLAFSGVVDLLSFLPLYLEVIAQVLRYSLLQFINAYVGYFLR